MKKIFFFLIPGIILSQTGGVGINTTNPLATLDVAGNLRIQAQELNTKQKVLIIDDDGYVFKTNYENINTGNGNNVNTDKVLINQSDYVRLNGTEVIGRLMLNSNVHINPTNTNVIKPKNDTNLDDWNLAGRLTTGKYKLNFDVRLFQNNLNRSSYIILRTISKTGEMFDAETFLIPETLDVGIDIPYNFNVSCPSDCMIQIYRVGNGLPNNIGFKMISLK